ncbi:MAG: trigger factor, partial [Saprospiraceae bacterium]
MAVSFNSTNHLEGTLTIHISESEYQPTLNKELNNYKSKAQLKGFRKGKTSVDLIKKMYGNAILQEVIENTLQKQLYDHIQLENLNVLGQPLPNAGQTPIYYDIFSPHDYVFKFDIGYAPEFEIKGLSDTYLYHNVSPDEATVDKQLQNLRDRNGELKSIEGPVSELNLLTIEATELKDGQISEDGIKSEFSVWISQINEEVRSQFIGKMNGDHLDIDDIQSMHPDKDEAFIRQRYFNTLDEKTTLPHAFRLTIKEIKVNEPAELNEAFFEKTFGPGAVINESEAKEKLKEELEKQMRFQSDALLFRDVQDKILKENEQSLPDLFLKRWLKVQNEKLTDEQIEADYPDFVQNLMWTILREKLMKKFDIQVSREEIKGRFRSQILSYFGGMAMGDLSFMDPTIEKMMANREQVEKIHDEVSTDKLFDQLKNTVQLDYKPTTESEFNELMEAAKKDTAARREKSQARQRLSDPHDHSHDHDHDHDH